MYPEPRSDSELTSPTPKSSSCNVSEPFLASTPQLYPNKVQDGKMLVARHAAANSIQTFSRSLTAKANDKAPFLHRFCTAHAAEQGNHKWETASASASASVKFPRAYSYFPLVHSLVGHVNSLSQFSLPLPLVCFLPTFFRPTSLLCTTHSSIAPSHQAPGALHFVPPRCLFQFQTTYTRTRDP